jgi:hypothetical protein
MIVTLPDNLVRSIQDSDVLSQLKKGVNRFFKSRHFQATLYYSDFYLIDKKKTVYPDYACKAHFP